MKRAQRKVVEKLIRSGPKNPAENAQVAQFLQFMLQDRRLQQAADILKKASDRVFDFPQSAHLAAVVFFEIEEFSKAADCMRRCVNSVPNDPVLLNDFGQILKAAGLMGEAISSYRKAVSLRPDYTDALSNLGNALVATNDLEAAEQAYTRAESINPDAPRILYNLGNLRLKQCRYAEAKQHFEKSRSLGYANDDVEVNLANCHLELGNWSRVDEILSPLIERAAPSPLALATAAILADQRRQYDFRDELVERCLATGAMLPIALLMKGSTLAKAGNLDELKQLAEPFNLKGSDKAQFEAYLYFACQNGCHWGPEQTDLSLRIDQAIRDFPSVPVEAPLQTTSRTDDPEATLLSARASVSKLEAISNTFAPLALHKNERPPKLRVGYVSYDFKDHAISHLVAPMFAMHSRTTFEIVGFAMNADDGSDYRRTVHKGCDEFFDLSSMGGLDAASKIADQNIDVLIDLNGHTKGNRLDIFVYRPAPVTITWLGFPGTSGTSFIDYVVVDRVVCDDVISRQMSEKPIYLPKTYQFAADYETSERMSKIDAGLPSSAVVLSCMNQAYKIEKAAFQAWMDLMRSHPDTVLWLLDQGSIVRNNLRSFAEVTGISSERIIFAERVSKNEHLKRLSAADLALDTLTYNGHTTTRDCINAGVPLVTVKGRHFPSRVSASLLESHGLDELVTSGLTEYLKLANDLLDDKEKLEKQKERVLTHARTHRISMETCVQDLEKGIQKAWGNYFAGRAPEEIIVN